MVRALNPKKKTMHPNSKPLRLDKKKLMTEPLGETIGSIRNQVETRILMKRFEINTSH